MDNQDKLHGQFKDAARKAETKDFARMEAVWTRVEEKLDHTELKKKASLWKYIGIAATLLLFMGAGVFLLNNENNNPVTAPQAIPENTVTVIDTQKVEKILAPAKADSHEAVVTTVTSATTVIPYASSDNAEPVAPEAEKAEALKGYTDAVTAAPATKSSATVNREMEIPPVSANALVAYQNTNAKVAEPTLFKSGRTVNGIITDENGMPIPGVDVTIEGTNKKAQTDFDGIYTIDAKAGEKLVANYVGMKSQVVILGEKKDNINFTMKDINETLGDAVVVVGYRNTTSARSNIAVTTVTSKAIQGRPNANFTQTLQGQVPGLNITNASGQTPITFRDRQKKSDMDKESYEKYYSIGGGGTDDETIAEVSSSISLPFAYFPIGDGDEPLYIIDGHLANEAVFRKIDHNNIEYQKVITKDEATAIYGTKGVNGAVIIKNKNPLSKRQIKKLIKETKKEDLYKFEPQEQEQPEEAYDEDYDSFVENQFENPVAAPLSTFSIDVDNASYTNVRRFINNGEHVPKYAVRVEEMINFFKYQYPHPTNNEPFSINTEYSTAPWNTNHKLLKIGLQGKIIPDHNLPSSNFVFLIDVSGSMNDENKLPLLKQSMKLLVRQMRAKDKISIVVYAGAAGVVLPATAGNQKDTIIAALDKLNAGGSTAGGEGIELAYKIAQENFIRNGNNRVILATDGDFNVGLSSDSDMQTLIEAKRKSGIFLTCLGYGMGDYKDSKLETLADKGNGNYAYIDSMQEADRYLNKEFKGSMYAIAKDVKIQIEFNPKHVQSYRLIGYENRKLRDEDFTNDAIDAGELGSGHTVTALYEIIPAGVKSDYFNPAPELKYSQPAGQADNYNNELATIKFRSKKPDAEKSTEIVQIIPDNPIPLQATSSDYKFAAAVAWFGLKLRDSQLIPDKDSEHIKKLAGQGLSNDNEGYKAEFIRLVEMME